MPFPLRAFALTAVVSMSAPAQRHDWPVYLGDEQSDLPGVEDVVTAVGEDDDFPARFHCAREATNLCLV